MYIRQGILIIYGFQYITIFKGVNSGRGWSNIGIYGCGFVKKKTSDICHVIRDEG